MKATLTDRIITLTEIPTHGDFWVCVYLNDKNILDGSARVTKGEHGVSVTGPSRQIPLPKVGQGKVDVDVYQKLTPAVRDQPHGGVPRALGPYEVAPPMTKPQRMLWEDDLTKLIGDHVFDAHVEHQSEVHTLVRVESFSFQI